MDILSLEPPTPVSPVLAAQVAGIVPIDATTRAQLREKVDRYIADLLTLDAKSPEFAIKAGQLSNLGRREMAAVGIQSDRFFALSGRALDQGYLQTGLGQLRAIVEDLDPSRYGNLLGSRHILGIIPFGSKLKNYFARYVPAQSAIDTILRTLAIGRDGLLQDNIAIDSERRHMWEQMGSLEQMIEVSKELDAGLERAACDLSNRDPAMAQAVRETALFQVRQRNQDLLTQMAVALQGYMALDLIRKNNVELIRGIDRASTTTIVALRTAITVASALAGEKLLLDQIAALNGAASNMIDGAGSLLTDTGARIGEVASSGAANLAALQRAFDNIHATMDVVDSFKKQALGNLKLTIDALATETEKSRSRLGKNDNRIKPADGGLGFG